MSEKITPASSVPLDATRILSELKPANRIDFFKHTGHFSEQSFEQRYRITREIAGGGMGDILAATDLMFEREVAIKRLRSEYHGNAQAEKAFVEEFLLCSKLDHPSIVPIYSIGQDSQGQWNAAMKLIRGKTMRTFLDNLKSSYQKQKPTAKKERIALYSRLEIFCKICEGVEYIHELKIIHSDLKPENIMLGPYGEVYVMDWGNSHREGTVLEHRSGTPQYLPPEFFGDSKLTCELDIFSLGMMLFEIVTMRRAVSGATPQEIVAKIANNRIEDLVHQIPSLSIDKELKAIIRKAISYAPINRYRNVRALLADIRHYMYDEEVSARPDSMIQKMLRYLYRHRIKTALLATSFVLLVGGASLGREWKYRNEQLQNSRQFSLFQQVQRDTEERTAEIDNDLLVLHGGLMLLADNLMEDCMKPQSQPGQFYDNKDYLISAQSSDADTTSEENDRPPHLFKSEKYPRPLTTESMVRILPAKIKFEQNLIDNAEYTRICSKILHYMLRKGNAMSEPHQGGCTAINGDGATIHRLFVEWANGIRYSFPGMYENTDGPEYRTRWENIEETIRNNRLTWSIPYPGRLGFYRVNMKYPFFDGNQNLLGVAGIELRFEVVIAPLITPGENPIPSVRRYIIIPERSSFEMKPDPTKIGGISLISAPDKLQAFVQDLVRKKEEFGILDETLFVSISPILSFNGIYVQVVPIADLLSQSGNETNSFGKKAQ